MRTALVVIDMLNDFVDGVLANPAAAPIVDPIGRLAGAVRGEPDWQVVYANDAHHPDDVELRVLQPHAMAGTSGAAVVDRLRPEPGDVVVEKRFYSAFTGTELDARLRSQGVDRLVLVGQHTDCCVRHTGFDAFCRGYDLVVCPDLTTVFAPGSDEPTERRQERALDYLRTYYAVRLRPSDAVA